MLWRHITILGLIAAAFVVALYDSAAAYFGGVDSTITDVVRDYSSRNTVIPLVLGILAGHLCGQFPIAFFVGYGSGMMFWNPAGQKFRSLFPPLGKWT